MTKVDVGDIRKREGCDLASKSGDARLMTSALSTPDDATPSHDVDRPSALQNNIFVQKIAEGFQQEVEFGHLFLWSPVFIGAGAVFWFVRPVPAPLGLLAVAAVAASAAAFVAGARRPVLKCIFLIMACTFSGAALARFETARLDTLILDSAVTTTIRGVVTAFESDSMGRYRYEVRLLETESPRLRRMPKVMMITAPARASAFGVGDGFEGRARLSPPSGPALVGLNDFAFDAYFSGIGGYGFFYGKPKPWRPPDALKPASGAMDLLSQSLEEIRNAVSSRIRTVLPGDGGAFAASMVTDDRRAISKGTTEDLRRAGLAHIVAISGLNMALAAGLFFVGLRMLLSLSQTIAHTWPVKRIAAAGALFTVTLYYMISGFAVSAERAYVMMAIMLTASVIGRPSISLRNVALSALVILVIAPSAVLGPGFQMSYAATLALVVGYSAWQRRSAGPSIFEAISVLKPLAPVWRFMTGVFITSLIGGVSTALYSAEHFHRLAAWGLPANLLAMPIISFIVMPAGVLALLLMPFGLDWPALMAMGFGLDWVIAIAHWAASLGGNWVTGRLPPWFFVGMTAGLITLSLMRSQLRFVGGAVSVLCVAVLILAPRPSTPWLVVYEDGALLGYLDANTIALSQTKPTAFILEQWQRALKRDVWLAPEMVKGPKTEASARMLTQAELQQARKRLETLVRNAPYGMFSCEEKSFCILKLDNETKVIVALQGAYVGIACDMANIVVTPVRLKWDSCRSGAPLLTGESLRRSGSLEFYRPSNGAPTIAAALETTQRPWSRHRQYDWRTDQFK